MCFPAAAVGEDISLLIYINSSIQVSDYATVKHDSINTAYELLSETLVEA